jgi:hypothetical protein
VAGPPHGRSHRRRAARPGHPRRGRFRLRRGGAEKLPPRITWTTRLRKDARLFAPPPARTGRRGAPRKKGDRLPCLAGLAATAEFTPVTVTRYGKTQVVRAAAITCLWYYVTGTRPVTVVLIRDKSARGFDLALVTTDPAASAAQVGSVKLTV